MSEQNTPIVLARIEEQLLQVRSSIGALQIAVSGNGNPDKGLLQRVDRIEQASIACRTRYDDILKKNAESVEQIEAIISKTALQKEEMRGKFWIEALKTGAVLAVLLMQILK